MCVYYTFSVTLYSNRFPSISLVCASSPGRAERKNEMMGRVNHCKYKNGNFHLAYSAGFGGLIRQSMINTMTKKMVERVRIPDESCARLCPSTVLPNAGFMSGGIVLPIVRRNQFAGQKICCSSIMATRLNLSKNEISVCKNAFLMTNGISDTPHAHRLDCSY